MNLTIRGQVTHQLNSVHMVSISLTVRSMLEKLILRVLTILYWFSFPNNVKRKKILEKKLQLL
jgi:hypothetical protein